MPNPIIVVNTDALRLVSAHERSDKASGKAVWGMRQIKKMGFDIGYVLLKAQGDTFETERWLKLSGFPQPRFIQRLGRPEAKTSCLASVRAKAMIESDPKSAHWTASHGFPTLLLGVDETIGPSKLIQVDTWEQVVSWFQSQPSLLP